MAQAHALLLCWLWQHATSPADCAQHTPSSEHPQQGRAHSTRGTSSGYATWM